MKANRKNPYGTGVQGFSNQPVYVMSGIDTYYEKLGYRREGSIFEVKAK